MAFYPDKHRSQHLKAALGYAERKIAVLPLRKDKTPLTHNGVKDATTDRSRITALWTRHPGANIGVATGGITGLVVVDRDGDSPEAARLWDSLPPTLEVKTSRGRHRYYRVREPLGTKVKSRKLAADVDLKADGGYVVAPPSIHPDGPRYKFVEETQAIGVADFPDEMLVEPEPREQGSRRRGSSTVPLDDGGPIPEGSRNSTIFFRALDLKEAGKSRGEALDEILGVNDARCAPPLGPDEVERVVTSAYRYPMRGKRTPPEVLEALTPLKRAWWFSPWRGVGGKSERDIVRVLLKLAERYGHLIPTGVRISISIRDLAIAAGCGKSTVTRVAGRLRLAGWLRGDNAQRCGTDSGAFVLLPRPTGDTQGMGGGRKGEDAVSVPTLSRLPELTPCFRWRGFVGKGRAGVLNALEVFGEQSLEELAGRLGWSRVRDLRARYLGPLIDLGLIEDRGGVYALVGHYAERVEEVRAARYGGGERKVTSKNPDGRVVSRVIYIEPKSEVDREEDDRRSYAGQRIRYRENIGLVRPVIAGEVPTEEEMQEHRESFDARRRRDIEEAIARLFSQRPEYRCRRVGQITCDIVPYLEADFPRGGVGLPKDAEVEAILDGVAA